MRQAYPVPVISTKLLRLQDVAITQQAYPRGNEGDKTEFSSETLRSLRKYDCKGYPGKWAPKGKVFTN